MDSTIYSLYFLIGCYGVGRLLSLCVKNLLEQKGDTAKMMHVLFLKLLPALIISILWLISTIAMPRWVFNTEIIHNVGS